MANPEILLDRALEIVCQLARLRLADEIENGADIEDIKLKLLAVGTIEFVVEANREDRNK